jgi:hypothetical protein
VDDEVQHPVAYYRGPKDPCPKRVAAHDPIDPYVLQQLHPVITTFAGDAQGPGDILGT